MTKDVEMSCYKFGWSLIRSYKNFMALNVGNLIFEAGFWGPNLRWIKVVDLHWNLNLHFKYVVIVEAEFSFDSCIYHLSQLQSLWRMYLIDFRKWSGHIECWKTTTFIERMESYEDNGMKCQCRYAIGNLFSF